MSEILIYQENENTSVEVILEGETVWLSLNQLSELFERDKSVISRHIKHIFSEEELEASSVVANIATTAKDGKIYKVDHYNLDAIISVGYRVNSKRGVQFRQWANQILKNYLIEGYALNQKHLLQKGMKDLEKSIDLLGRVLPVSTSQSDVSQEAIKIIKEYARSWQVLLQYDEKDFSSFNPGRPPKISLDYSLALSTISNFKKELRKKGEASELFGIEREEGLKSIIGNIEQTFASQRLYPTIEETASHLLYFVIKDHPFTDGNKRIGSLLFLLYLRLNNLNTEKINEVTLVALALLVAESQPMEKDSVISLIVNLIRE